MQDSEMGRRSSYPRHALYVPVAYYVVHGIQWHGRPVTNAKYCRPIVWSAWEQTRNVTAADVRLTASRSDKSHQVPRYGVRNNSNYCPQELPVKYFLNSFAWKLFKLREMLRSSCDASRFGLFDSQASIHKFFNANFESGDIIIGKTAVLESWPFLEDVWFESSLRWLSRVPSYGMLCRAALMRTNVSEEHIVSIIRVTRIGELETTLAVTSNPSTQRYPDNRGDTFL
jgi:hypothetical protein